MRQTQFPAVRHMGLSIRGMAALKRAALKSIILEDSPVEEEGGEETVMAA